MQKFGLFQRFWADTSKKIETIVARRGARAYMPVTIIKKTTSDHNYKLTFCSPAFFSNVPQKGSSTKNGPSHKQAIFVDGSFSVAEHNGQVVLTNAACNMSIYDSRTSEDGAYLLRLVDAMHFDMEGETQSEFHPIFHVQRGLSKSITHEMMVNKIVQSLRTLNSENIKIDDDGIPIGLSYVRLPTPQMDYFAVLATIVADFFCSEGQSDLNAKDQFRALLQSITNKKNIVRNGKQAQTLCGRWNEQHPFAATHWYAESR